MKVEFYKHNVNDKDIARVTEVLRSGFLTTGRVVREFEEQFAKYFDVARAVGTTSCTNSLFLALKATGIKKGDEVITTPMTFVATPNSVLHCGAQPVFADVESKTGLIDPIEIEKKITNNTKAIIPVHIHGQMADMRSINNIATKYNLAVIEDACHAIESSREGIKPGQLSDAACFSFYATKNITSGEGGALITNNEAIGQYVSKARLHGVNKTANDRYGQNTFSHYDMEFLGYKFNMNNIQAAILIGQLKRIEETHQRKVEVATFYNQELNGIAHLELFETIPDSIHGQHIYTIKVPSKHRDSILNRLIESGVGCAVNYRAAHLMSYYKNEFGYKVGDYPNAEDIGDRTITLPFYPKLKQAELRFVVDQLKRIMLSI